MDRKKIIKRIAVPVTIIFIISVIILILQIPFRNNQYAKHLEKGQIYFEEFSKEQEAYLNKIADKIKKVRVEPEIVELLRSECSVTLQEKEKEKEKSKKIFWITSSEGEHFQNLARTKNFDFYPLNTPGYLKSMIPNFRAPLYHVSDGNRLILNMRIDDYKNRKLYYNRDMLEKDDLYSILNPIFGILGVLSGLFLWFLIPTWVYTDAQRRNVKNPGIWALLSLVSLFYGLTVYLITRPSKAKLFHCPKCEGELNGTRAYCPHCGNDLSSTFCQECQYPVKSDWSFCPNCRASIKKD